jgi:hypothetical protein
LPRFYWFGFWVGRIRGRAIGDIRKQTISMAYQGTVRQRLICYAGLIIEEVRFLKGEKQSHPSIISPGMV